MNRRRFIARGYLTLEALVFGAIGLLIIGAIIGWGAVNDRAATKFSDSEEAFQIAEAGIEYYRWHLAHAPQDFSDGTTNPGPYVHDYFAPSGVQIGTFSLAITPPLVGSTVVKIVSTGQVTADPGVKRAIEVKLAIPSLAKYAVVANAPMRFGAGTEVFGPIQSNNGIRFDGLAHNLVTSAVSNYDDPDHSGPNEFGVHTHVVPPPGSGVDNNFQSAEAPPNPVPSRPDVFMAGRQFPVPAVDFGGLTTDLANIKTAAQSGGQYFASSGVQGYDLVFSYNPVAATTTYLVYKVSSLASPPSGCANFLSQSGWGTWSIANEHQSKDLYVKNNLAASTFNLPANGLIFVEDNVWLEGQIGNARVTVASARFPDNPSTNSNITVNHNLQYTNYNGQDIIGLIAQGNFNVGLMSDTNLTIDGALVAKNGRVGRYYYYSPSCDPDAIRNSLTLDGMITTNQRYGFAYTDGTGYQIRNISYDGNLLYGPPPSFPLTGDNYQTISWREVAPP